MVWASGHGPVVCPGGCPGTGLPPGPPQPTSTSQAWPSVASGLASGACRLVLGGAVGGLWCSWRLPVGTRAAGHGHHSHQQGQAWPSVASGLASGACRLLLVVPQQGCSRSPARLGRLATQVAHPSLPSSRPSASGLACPWAGHGRGRAWVLGGREGGHQSDRAGRGGGYSGLPLPQ